MSAWQPIETAPKDRWVLYYTPETNNPDFNIDVATSDIVSNWDCKPTHWMPLPKPPL